MRYIITTLLLSMLSLNILSAKNSSITEIVKVNYPNTNWELIKTESNIKVYVSNYVWDDGALKLKLKFENTSSNDINIVFEVVSKQSSDVVGTYKILVKANSSSEFMNEKEPIEIAVGQTEKDFDINFK